MSLRAGMSGCWRDLPKHVPILKEIGIIKYGRMGIKQKIFSTSFLYEKHEYIHNNPVQDLIVENPEDYMFSSARNYAGLDNYL